MFNKLRTVVYHVNDLQQAKEWYTKAIGIEPYFDEPFYMGFDINGFELGLDPDMNGVEKGNHHVAYWQVDDIHAAVEKLVSLKGTIVSPINNVGGTIEVATVADPFGNHIGLITGA